MKHSQQGGLAGRRAIMGIVGIYRAAGGGCDAVNNARE